MLAALMAPQVHAEPATEPSLNAQLLVAARQGDVPAVRRALAGGATADSRNRLGKTALLLACEKGQAEVVRLLLARGADANLRDDRGFTAAAMSRDAGPAAAAALLQP